MKMTAIKDPHTAPAIAADLSPGVLPLSVMVYIMQNKQILFSGELVTKT